MMTTIQDLERRGFIMADVLADVRIMAVTASKKGLEFREESDDVLPIPLMGDALRLRQVLTNLLSNAIKFTTVGSVVFSYRQVEETVDTLRVRVTVADSGIGIKREALPHLFQPFHQADASTARLFGGTGLGLCIAKNVCVILSPNLNRFHSLTKP